MNPARPQSTPLARFIWAALGATALTVAATILLPSRTASSQAPGPSVSSSSPPGEITTLKTLLPDQSHAMADVAYHMTNAWFAGREKNWPLAGFYLDETAGHIGWAVRIKPARKGPDQKDFPLQPYADALVKGPLAELKAAVDKQDGAGFEKAYETTLGACYACHVASGKPYLRLRIPEVPAASIVQFAPAP